MIKVLGPRCSRTDLCTKLQFMRQATVKRNPPPFAAPNVSLARKLGGQRLTWAPFPRNNLPPSPAFSFFPLVLPVSQSSKCHGSPPSSQTTNNKQSLHTRPLGTATYFPLHMLMLQPHSCCWGLCQGRGQRRLPALRDSCMHFTEMTTRWLADLSLLHSVLLPILPHFSP